MTYVIYSTNLKMCGASILSKTQLKFPIGITYKGVIRPGGQATTMMPIAS